MNITTEAWIGGGAVVDANLAVVAEAYDGVIDVTAATARTNERTAEVTV